jgi:hypothetical protein
VDPLETFLEHWDTLVFVEATIYGLDEDVERAALAGSPSPAHSSPKLTALLHILQDRGVLTAALQDELSSGLAYWAEECRLGAHMLAAGAVPAGGHDGVRLGFTLEEVHAASEKKSFDYRVLNHLVYALRGETPNPALLAFLAVDETLLDTGDDLVDYEDDCCENAFNILRAYTHLFGSAAPLRMIDRISRLEARHAELLARLPPELQRRIESRKRSAAEGDGALRWVLPEPILDEASFRQKFAGGP